MTLPALYISTTIDRPADEIYAFVRNPENLPKWAAGLSAGMKKIGDDWFGDSPMGPVKITFTEQNSFGVLDHDVTLPSGVTFPNPMRVFPNGDGSEFVFTLFRQPEMTDDAFEADKKAIEKDLETLKRILEQ